MTGERAQTTAEAAAGIAEHLDGNLLTELVDALYGTPDARRAKREIERRTSGRTCASLLDLFDTAEHEMAILALDAAARAAQAIRERLGEATVVWTGPTVRTLAVRPTLQVVLELIRRARTSLTVVTYAGHNIAELVSAIDSARLDHAVSVRLLLETEADSGGRLKGDAAAAFGNLPKAVPVYRWPLANRGAAGGAMHVKTVIKDRDSMLVSSANFTGAAMDRNMELGLLVEGGDLPEVVDRHFDELIEAGQIVKVS